MGIVFFQFWPKSTPKIKNFYTKFLHFNKFKGADLKYDNSFLKFLSKKAFLEPSWKVFFVLCETRQFYKFQSVNFKCSNKCLKPLPKNTQTRQFRPNYMKFLFLLKYFNFEKIDGTDSEYNQRILKFLPTKHPNKVFSVLQDTILLCHKISRLVDLFQRLLFLKSKRIHFLEIFVFGVLVSFWSFYTFYSL